MRTMRAAGRNAASLKYDVLTALLAYGLAGQGAEARLAPRLAVLITARYNWQSGSMCVGQREIARLWSVTDRTVKRDMAEMRARGWLVIKRPAARGRITEYGIDLDRLLDETRPVWSAVGPDFAARMAPREAEAFEAGQGNVVPFARGAVPLADGTLWSEVAAGLRDEAPALWSAWLSKLVEARREGGRVVLAAPSDFVAAYVATHLAGRLLAAFSARDGSVREVRVVAAGQGG